MMRKDVQHLAERLHSASGLNTDSIYDWLMDLGRSTGVNPCKLSYLTAPGSIFHDAENYLQRVQEAQKECDDCAADFWENKILERQEAWMD